MNAKSCLLRSNNRVGARARLVAKPVGTLGDDSSIDICQHDASGLVVEATLVVVVIEALGGPVHEVLSLLPIFSIP